MNKNRITMLMTWVALVVSLIAVVGDTRRSVQIGSVTC